MTAIVKDWKNPGQIALTGVLQPHIGGDM